MHIGHADAAMHLHRLVRDEMQRLGGARLGERSQLRDVVGVAVQRIQRRSDAGAGQFELGEHDRRAMLQRLERADQLAELLAHLQVFRRHLEGRIRRAQHFRRQADAGAIEDLRRATAKPPSTVPSTASAPTSTLAKVMFAAACASSVFSAVRVTPFAFAGTRNSVIPVCVARIARRARRDDQQIRFAAIDDIALVAD